MQSQPQEVLAALDFIPSEVCTFPDCPEPAAYRYACHSCRRGIGCMCDAHHGRVTTQHVILSCQGCKAVGSSRSIITFERIRGG